MIDKRPVIGVMGSHDRSWEQYAHPLGRMIAEHDYHLLTGAGGGAMTAVAKGFVEVQNRAGYSIGIVPTLSYSGDFVESETYPNPYVEVPILTPLDARAQNDIRPFSRNYVNIMSSHAIIALPGDHGTQNEVSLALTFKKPLILFGPEAAFAKFPGHPSRTDDIDEVREFLERVTAKFRKGDEK